MALINWILLAAIGVVVFVTLVASVSNSTKKKKTQKHEVQGNGVDEVIEQKSFRRKPLDRMPGKDISKNIPPKKGEIILAVKKTAIVSKQGPVRPGKYTISSSDVGNETFSIRIGLDVKEYKNNDKIILVEGDEITPISTKIVLK